VGINDIAHDAVSDPVVAIRADSSVITIDFVKNRIHVIVELAITDLVCTDVYVVVGELMDIAELHPNFALKFKEKFIERHVNASLFSDIKIVIDKYMRYCDYIDNHMIV